MEGGRERGREWGREWRMERGTKMPNRNGWASLDGY
mgnify:CR=1 FL=1